MLLKILKLSWHILFNTISAFSYMVIMIQAGFILWQVYLPEKHASQTQNSYLKQGLWD
jgi:hypothetical protein